MRLKPVGIDTGGTWTRIAAGDADEIVVRVRTSTTKNEYLDFLAEQSHLLEAAFFVDAVAGPISPDGSSVKITNQEWGILTTDEIRKASGAAKVMLVNDLVGVGAGVVHVEKNQPERIIYISGRSVPMDYRLVVAPGTGIGVARITPDGGVLGGEGGWVLAQPTDEEEGGVIQELQKKLRRNVSCEDLARNPAIYEIWYKSFFGDECLGIKNEDKPADIARLAKQSDANCLFAMRKAAKFLGQCAQANMLSPPMARALCMVGSFEKDMEVNGYVDAFLDSLYHSRHGGLLKEAPVYTVRDSGDLGAMGSLAIAKRYVNME